MPAIDSYAPCPCGSGEKYKWCCHKAESFIERSARLAQSGQVDAALKIIDEGLRSLPENPWLGLRKAAFFLRRNDYEAAYPVSKRLAEHHPKHAGIQSLYIQLLARNGKPQVAAGALQTALAAIPAERRKDLAAAATQVAVEFGEADAIPAALAHFALAVVLDPEHRVAVQSAVRGIEADDACSPWLRNEYRLSPVPSGVAEPQAGRFKNALNLAEQGLWAAAAREFDSLSNLGTPESDRNLGLCRLWLGDHAGAVDAIRRYTSWIGSRVDTIDLEALCQEIEPLRQDETVEQLQWIWVIRDRQKLVDALVTDKRVVPMGQRHLNPGDENSPEVESFYVLDKPLAEIEKLENPDGLSIIEGTLLIGQELAVIEAFDDGRLDRIADWFRECAGTAIPPAHPRTKHISRAPKHKIALKFEWALPAGAVLKEMQRTLQEGRVRNLRKVWPKTPFPALGGRTPEAAARDQDATLPLQAALDAIEWDELAIPASIPSALRAQLGVKPEPEIDLNVVGIEAVHLARLPRIDPKKLSDKQLLVYFHRVQRYHLLWPITQAGLALAERPDLQQSPEGISTYEVYSALAYAAISQDEPDEALRWLERGRAAEPASQRAATAPHWELLELRLRTKSDPAEQWVPFLAALLDRYRDSPENSELILSALLSMGLVHPVRDPEQPEQIFLDSRPLEALLARYGPRITTADGELGVSAARPAIWTPESEARGTTPGGVWTPDQGTAGADPNKSKLIIPGR
jgi:tetratricopeptide (TPR) repeat protein